MNLENLKTVFAGDIENTELVREKYSHDASLFTVVPELVVFPKTTQDIKNLITWVITENTQNSHIPDYKILTVTMRAAGTCMSGGSLTTSIVVDTTRYMNNILEITDDYVCMQSGVMYRDLEIETLKRNRIMPAYTASKNICAVGGMFGNNCGGEKTLKYGKLENFILETKCIFSDGNEYTVKPLNKLELEQKITQNDFEGNVYKHVWDLLQNNTELVMNAKPRVSKNSAGYYLWNVWNSDTGVFDLNKLLVGSQGTLGLVTEMVWRLVPVEPVSNVLAIYLPDLERLGELSVTLAECKPDSIESFDDHSLKLAFRFFFDFLSSMGIWQFIKLGWAMIPDGIKILTGGIPKIIVLVEVCGTNEEHVKQKLQTIELSIAGFGYKTHICKNSTEAEKYWRIRRESFNLLRKHIAGKRTAPCIDDIIVDPKHLPEFMPKIIEILDTTGCVYTIAGHVGDGNFHIIPLLDMKLNSSRDFVINVSRQVYDLVISLGGSITAEHNDGIMRTPFLRQMYGDDIVQLFQQTKKIFDPNNLLNPNKKVNGSFADIEKYLVTK